jgi:DNA-binding NtrC family response regulator
MTEKILIVDDDASFRRVVDYTLKEEGYETTLATNGEEALNLFSESEFSLVVTDVLMPQLGGLELLRRTQAISPEVPVVVVTAHAAVEDAVHAMREGAFDYIEKPVNRDQLKFVVQKALEVKELRREFEKSSKWRLKPRVWTRRSSFSVRAEPARSFSPRRFTSRAPERAGLSSSSIAAPFRRLFSSRSFSATAEVRSPGPSPSARAK